MARVPLDLKPATRAALQGDLLAWFSAMRRDLPWRGTDDLYGIWVSEIMLQQTTVQAVIPYWHRFVSRFPTVADLASASEAEVLSLWSGLGYYSRARNLLAAARLICGRGTADLPQSRAAWAELPGVGPYASGAIASLGLGERVPALDANARRVIMRWSVTDAGQWAALPAAARQRQVDQLGAELVPAGDPGTWNEAVMELGALVCGARAAACPECPVRNHCAAHAGGWVADVPPPAGRAAVTAVEADLLLVTWRGKVLLLPPASAPIPVADGDRVAVRTDFTALHRGLWGLPMTPWFKGTTAPLEAPAAAADWVRAQGVPLAAGCDFDLLGGFSHSITRYRIRLSVWGVELDARCDLPAQMVTDPDLEPPRESGPGVRFFPRYGSALPVSAMTEKALHFHNDSVV